ncbi:YhdP family protein [Aliiglaciecola sp. 3_MG-2023]|uniref:YhdP family protein n=1 Tax=Aliiglaciecola sp. 3_MG-2023 TaxID=3062644 RepID=UPI0026E29E5B|nr:YhdP family protein [Aliiglaciecola sp. 3_MG-2023]MDO6695797.1 YhdP family protein [Aliiglaciecola sp. 3_MG-2023]
MKPASFYAAYLVRKLWTLAAVLLVLVAVGLSIVRFSLPYLDGNKQQIETWLSNRYGINLTIGELTANWAKSGPSLVLKNIKLQQDAQSPIGLEIEDTQIEIDFWSTLVARQIQSRRFELSGLALSVNLARIQTSESKFPVVDALEDLFLQQLQRFSISNSVIDVTTQYDQQLIQIQQLRWLNKDNRHQGEGLLRVVELANNSATFSLDLTGDKDNLSGTFYARGEEVDLSPWLNQLIRTQNQLTQSRGNFTFWAEVNKNSIKNVQMILNKSEFSWTSPESQVDAAIVGGRISGVPDAQGWQFNIDDLILESKQQSLLTSWTGHIGRNGLTHFQMTTPVNIRSLLPVLPLAFDKKTIDFIEQLKPNARIDELAILLGEQFSTTANFSNVSWNQVDGLPGVDHVAGSFHMFDNLGKLSINGRQGEFAANNTLDENINYQSIDFDVFLDWQPRGVQVDIPNFSLVGNELNIDLQMAFDSKDNELNLFANIGKIDVEQAKKLLPDHYMGAQTKAYLQGAMLSGELASTQVLWQGSVNQFPFESHQGIFQISIDVNDSEFKFAPDWPQLTDMDVDLLFENKSLSMIAHEGKLKNVAFSDLSAQIPQLNNSAVLNIEADISAQSTDVTELILDSFLANTLGTVLTEGVNVSGTLETKLDLHIPLTGKNVLATGQVKLKGNPVYLPSLNLNFENMQGEVSFANEKVQFNGLKGELFNQQITANFDGFSDPSGAYKADIELQGDWQVQPLLQMHQPSMNIYLDGHSAWQANTQLTLNKSSYDYEFELVSNLQGVSSSLPAPFNKRSDQAKQLFVTGNGSNHASNFSLLLGDSISFEGVLPHDTMQFSRAHLAIGESESIAMGLGFSISASVKDADFDAWYQAIANLIGDIPRNNERPILAAPQRVHVNAENMLVAGQKINQLELVAKHLNDDWLLEFNAEQIRAKVTLYDDWLNRGVDIDADFIDLAQWHETENNPAIQGQDLQNLPPINFDCKSCKLFGKDLGKVDFSLSRAPTGMQIDSLRFNNNNGILYASGDWFISEQGSSTRLTGELSSPDFGALIKGLGFDSGIKDSKANFNFDLNWQDAPHKFSVASLGGNIDWRLTDGYLSEVSDKGSRIFSFLSLQSLVRKLSLDFRDVFAKGFFYDKMDGSLQIVSGKAETQDMVIDGAAGEMLIAGYTDLSSKELNYRIEFTPNVTSSLPLLVYWMVNPATAIAALAIDQVLTEAKVISNVKYSVTGTLDEPILTELDRKSKEVALPARNTPVELDEDDVPLQVLPDERVNLQIDDTRGY